MPDDHPLLQFLFSRHRFGLKPGLERISALLSYLGHPEKRFRVVHVGGTNGKGSCCAFLESLLQATGLRTGLYTSPHLVRPEERIRVNSIPIPGEALVDLIASLRPRIEESQATFFEAVTAIAFAYFAESRVDVAVVEVGLGGRWDATNVVWPEVTVITDVHLDHQNHLGRSVRAIAYEKAGILKPGVACCTYARTRAALRVLRERAAQVGAILHRQQSEGRVRVTGLSPEGTRFGYWGLQIRQPYLSTRLVGRHQARNAGLALLAFEVGGWAQVASEETIRRAIADTEWAGRFHILSVYPLRLLDVAHNVQGVRAFVRTFAELWPDQSDCTVVMGVLEDKPFRLMAGYLRRLAPRIVVCPLPTLRSADVEDMASQAQELGFAVQTALDPLDAWRRGEIWAGNSPLIAIGSHYLVGAILGGLGLEPR
ncbi:MAG: bifunctional folylpolyglutamate synthase/dihydrofolate synthase [candidate division KSB1 bacterium]|nr:bifunctional folylpolyglutamate synthase/dihydrofolate synthase [candidate division KSB1 bacterium]